MIRSALIFFWAGLFLLAGAGQPPAALAAGAAAPASFTVNSVFDVAANFSNDPGYTVCHTNANNSICTLRAAIMNANRHPGGATILLPSQTYVLSLPPVGPDDDASGNLNLTGTVTLQGSGANSTIIDGGGLDGVIRVNSGVVTLSGLTIQNGNAIVGGGIDNAGQLTLSDSVVSGNHAGVGGGLFNETGAVMLVRRSTIRDNTVTLDGGGGVESQGTLTIENSTVNANQAVRGGGIYSLNPGSLTLVNSTLSGNSATGTGGGVFADSPAVFYHTTIAGNVADSDQGAVSDTVTGFGGGVYPTTNGYVHAWNSLFAFNYVAHVANTCQGSNLTSDDYNYFQTAAGCTIAGSATHDQFGDPALLGPLADNGGATQTRALWPGSPALDRIPPARCRDQFGAVPVPDQRGVARPVNSLCDMGAYEGAQTQSLYFTNLVVNGDAEAAAGSPAGVWVGVPYWSGNIGEFTAVPYNSPGGFPAVPTDTVPSLHGENFFAGGSAVTSLRFQAVDVTTIGAAIDAGGVQYRLSADLGGYLGQSDNATFQISFYDSANALIGSPVTIGPVTPSDRNNQTGLLPRSTTAPVPAGARFISLVITLREVIGYNDGYADNLSLVLTPPYAVWLPLVRK